MLFLLLFACSAPMSIDRACIAPMLPATDGGHETSRETAQRVVSTTVSVVVTGYTSTVGETDATPCLAADRSNICKRHAAGEAICAANGYPFGTRLAVDSLGVCTVADRTHRRYAERVDWYFGRDRSAAKAFGKQRLPVTALP